jgi:WD40 repeat protein
MKDRGLKLTALLIGALLFQTPTAISQTQTPTVLSQTITITAVVTIKPPRRPPSILDRTHAWEFSSVSNTLAVILTVNNVVRLFLFDLKTGALRHDVEVSRKSERFSIRNIAFSPDGSRIAIPMGEERKLTLWNAMSGQKETEAAIETDVESVDWVGTTIAAVAGKYIEIWNAQPLMKKYAIKAGRTETEWPMSAKWSPDGQYLAIGTNTPAVYIAKGTSVSASLQPLPKGAVYLVDWSFDGTLLAAAGLGINSTIAVWKNVKTAIESPFEKKYQLTSFFVPPPGKSWERMTWAPTLQILAFGDSMTTFWFFDPTGNPLKTFVPHPGSVPYEAHWHGNQLVTAGLYPARDFKVWAISTTAILSR